MSGILLRCMLQSRCRRFNRLYPGLSHEVERLKVCFCCKACREETGKIMVASAST